MKKEKKTNKRTKRGAIAALCLAGVLAITGAFAFLSDSESAINRFSFADENGEQTVDVRIDEPNWHEEDGKDILPLETVTKDPQVVNQGENDAYAFVTVLVPTAKEIKLNDNAGGVYTEHDVELFAYEVNEGWTEISETTGKVAVDAAHQFSSKLADGSSISRSPVLLNTNTVDGIIVPQAITNRDAANSNIYYTAHTYAYAVDGMTKITSGDTTTPVFDYVTMINIADGARVKKTLEEVKAGLVAEEGTTIEIVDDTIVATKDSASQVIYKTVDDAVVDMNGNIQYKVTSQFSVDDNINVYVNTYAIQADNVNGDDIDACWTICANTNAGVAEGASYTNDFYFQILANDIGAKSAVKGA